MRMNYSSITRIYIGILLCFSAPLLSQSGDASVLSVENEFIKLVVNNRSTDTGRFAIESTGGNPENPSDNAQPLIYGRPRPWTSFSTFLIDDQPLIFGGPSRKHQQRSQTSSINVTGLREQFVSGNRLISISDVSGLVITQVLSFFRNPSTGVKDSALIRYDIVNSDTVPHRIGTRIMLDTKLGPNDGAPLRIGQLAVESEQIISGDAVVDFWQAFDALDSPTIVAQGTLRLTDSDITPPSRVALVNWGTLFDYPWEFDYQPKRSFIRDGEQEKDTALALYWDTQLLPPGESISISTIYGLGGVSLAAGELSLGLSTPSEAKSSSEERLLMVAYVANTSGFDSKNTVLKYELPLGFVPEGSSIRTDLGTLGAGEIRQFPLYVRMNNPQAGMYDLRLHVSSETLESNELSRPIRVLGPAILRNDLIVPRWLRFGSTPYVVVSGHFLNDTPFPIHDIHAQLELGSGVVFAPFDKKEKYIGRLTPGESAEVDWAIQMPDQTTSNFSLTMTTDSPLTPLQETVATLSIRPALSSYRLRPSVTSAAVNEAFFVECLVSDLTDDTPITLYIDDRPELVQLRISKGGEFYSDNHSLRLESSDRFIRLSDITFKERLTPVSLIKVHVYARTPGDYSFRLAKGDTIIQEVSVEVQ